MTDMNFDYFLKINNLYNSSSKQETDLYLLNRHAERMFDSTIGYEKVKRNNEDFELIIVKDTENNSYKKKIKSRPSQPFNLGDYIEWKGSIWIVSVLDTNERTYHSGYMYLCNLLIHWQDRQTGEIVRRFGYASDFTKYSMGVAGNNKIKMGDYQYGLMLPVDEKTKKLQRGYRFVIDFEGVEPPDTYRLVNKKIYLNDDSYFGRGGTIEVILTFDFYNEHTDKYIVLEDEKRVCICDYKENVNETTSDVEETSTDILHDYSMELTFNGENVLKMGAPYKLFSSKIFFKGEQIEIDKDKLSWELFAVDEILPLVQFIDSENGEIRIKIENNPMALGGIVKLTCQYEVEEGETICKSIELNIKSLI